MSPSPPPGICGCARRWRRGRRGRRARPSHVDAAAAGAGRHAHHHVVLEAEPEGRVGRLDPPPPDPTRRSPTPSLARRRGALEGALRRRPQRTAQSGYHAAASRRPGPAVFDRVRRAGAQRQTARNGGGCIVSVVTSWIAGTAPPSPPARRPAGGEHQREHQRDRAVAFRAARARDDEPATASTRRRHRAGGRPVQHPKGPARPTSPREQRAGTTGRRDRRRARREPRAPLARPVIHPSPPDAIIRSS